MTEGKKVVVGEDDYEITITLPPEGHVWNYKTKEFDKTDIISRSSIPAEQYWQPPSRPKDWYIKRKKEKAMQKIDAEFIDPELEAYREREWHRRLFGAWFLNNGVPTYITGTHYFFLTHWTLDVGLPEYRHMDYEFFHAWDFCVQSGDCAGLIILTKRRQGKTAKSGAIMYDRTSRVRKVQGGIQSKTWEDAKDIVFFNGIVQPFVHMIDFFVPTFDKGRDFPPKDKLRFFKKGERGEEIDFEQMAAMDHLESWISIRNSQEKAYDGSKLYTYIGDEVAKTDGVDVEKRHSIIRKTLLGQDGYSIIGKALYTTTVEEMNANSVTFRNLWDNSCQAELTKNGRTKSWLYRFFVPAYKTLFIDKYGFADQDRAKEFLMNERDALRDNPHMLASEIRQNPWTWRESFRPDGDTCLYNPQIIANRLEYLTWRKGIVKRGSLEWVDQDNKKEVKFVENPNGRFYVAHEPTNPNNVRWPRTDTPIPQNQLRYVIGIDPFDHDRTKSGAFSNGAAAVYKRHDSMDEGGNNFVCIYIGRPAHTYIFYEDMVKLCHWYGCQMLFEDQKPAIKRYFEMDRPYGAFMVRNEKGEVGISASTKTHLDIVEETGIFIQDHGDRTLFHQLLTDWSGFDINDTEKFDIGMASGYALIANSRMRRGLDKLISQPKKDIGKIFRMNKVRSNANY